jgi:hypothetical protein
VTGEGTCPSAALVDELLRRLLPNEQSPSGVSTTRVVVADLGDRFIVSVGLVRKEFEDPDRRCDERARDAAVFAAFSIPRIQREPPKEAAHVTAPQQGTDRRPFGDDGGRGLKVELDVSGTLVATAGADTTSSTPSGGATLRGSIGYRRRRALVGAAIGVTASAPVSLKYGDAGSRVLRIPIDLSLHASYRSGRWEGGAEAGPVLSVLIVSGDGFVVNQQTVRPELGIRAGLFGLVWLTRRLAAVVAFDAVAIPVPYDVAVAPQGTVGQLPKVWLSASAGLALNIH